LRLDPVQFVRFEDWDAYDAALSPVVEVYSSHGSSEGVGTPVPMADNPDMGPRTSGGTYRDALDVTRHPSFTDRAGETRDALKDAGLAVSGISSSISVCEPDLLDDHVAEARRTIAVADVFDAEYVRVFGHELPLTDDNVTNEDLGGRRVVLVAEVGLGVFQLLCLRSVALLLQRQDELRFDGTGHIVGQEVVVLEVQLGGDLVVAVRRHLEMKVGGTER
jgi:hypothetical protein